MPGDAAVDDVASFAPALPTESATYDHSVRAGDREIVPCFRSRRKPAGDLRREMPKKKTQIPALAEWFRALKVQFLAAAFHYSQTAFQQLGEDVRDGKMTVGEWAARFNVADTWIEEWAGDTIEYWELHPGVFPDYPQPRAERPDPFSFSITNSIPLCKSAIGITSLGSLPEGSEEDDCKRFKRFQHDELERKLEEYCKSAMPRLVIPDELQLKLEVAALYLFRNMSPAEIAKQREVGRDRTTVNRWLKEILSHLELRMKPKGWPRRE